MRLVVVAVGRLKQGAERQLAERYRERAVKAGRSLGLRGVELVEIEESRARDAERRMLEESIAIANVVPDDARRVLLDSGGEAVNSPAFAAALAQWRDTGAGDCAFIIGGPDGLADALRERIDLTLAFGAMTWPHQLVRIMLLEQISRRHHHGRPPVSSRVRPKTGRQGRRFMAADRALARRQRRGCHPAALEPSQFDA